MKRKPPPPEQPTRRSANADGQNLTSELLHDGVGLDVRSASVGAFSPLGKLSGGSRNQHQIGSMTGDTVRKSQKTTVK